ncbi:hypothetical protein T440DRAFT_86244 [Plenodomus tracheiphilus IPT5]|uniref:Uncharacterized protein n=1 Tax=Plenodomus tracheiphilus IPT5 TaxID=1408161 RepID=A0A6A7B6A3_9PLEO|nr:hypothetical protein T440DRAFT_86244 [Plenodomus tracheiphilus IPT5]
MLVSALEWMDGWMDIHHDWLVWGLVLWAVSPCCTCPPLLPSVPPPLSHPGLIVLEKSKSKSKSEWSLFSYRNRIGSLDTRRYRCVFCDNESVSVLFCYFFAFFFPPLPTKRLGQD